MSEIKKTCLYDMHVQLHAKMEEFAGFEMPIVYTSIQAEHLAVREKVGMFDVSHMGEIILKGKDALSYTNYLFSNEIDSKPFGKVIYGFMLYENGTVVDDLLVYKVSSEEVLLIVNASNIAKDYEWIVSNTDSFDVTVKNVSDDYSEIALQGPHAETFLKDEYLLDLSSLEFFTFGNFTLLDEEVLISRTGYTGEDGFEIYGSSDAIQKLWLDFISKNVVPCGLGARDTLRFEAALPLYSHELSDEITPITAGFKLFAKVDKGEFIGRDALLKEIKDGSKFKLVGIELIDRAIPRAHYPIFIGDEEIGHVTTGYLSISLNKPIAFGLVKTEYSSLGTSIQVQIRNKFVNGFVRDRKFLKKNYKTK